MRKIIRIVYITLFCYGSLTVSAYAEPDSPSDIKKTQVVIIGTIHSKHSKNPRYSPQVLKNIILSLKPSVILNELPLSQVDPNGRPLFRDPNKYPEGWAADTVATELGIKQIPFDRPDRQENFKKTNYFEREKNLSKGINKWYEQAKREEPNSIDLKIALLWWEDVEVASEHLMLNGSPEIINSPANDSMIRIKLSIWYDISPGILLKYTGYEDLIADCKFFKEQWHIRNRIMADNIVKATKDYAGKRLVVVTGCYHRYILRDLLKDEKSIELKEYWEVIQKPVVNNK